jgi:hypothetical protein
VETLFNNYNVTEGTPKEVCINQIDKAGEVFIRLDSPDSEVYANWNGNPNLYLREEYPYYELDMERGGVMYESEYKTGTGEEHKQEPYKFYKTLPGSEGLTLGQLVVGKVAQNGIGRACLPFKEVGKGTTPNYMYSEDSLGGTEVVQIDQWAAVVTTQSQLEEILVATDCKGGRMEELLQHELTISDGAGILVYWDDSELLYDRLIDNDVQYYQKQEPHFQFFEYKNDSWYTLEETKQKKEKSGMLPSEFVFSMHWVWTVKGAVYWSSVYAKLKAIESEQHVSEIDPDDVDALMDCFVFNDTEEGHSYWMEVSAELDKEIARQRLGQPVSGHTHQQVEPVTIPEKVSDVRLGYSDSSIEEKTVLDEHKETLENLKQQTKSKLRDRDWETC